MAGDGTFMDHPEYNPALSRGRAPVASVIVVPQGERPEPDRVQLPAGVVGGTYQASIPLIRPSKLTSRSNGGVGKQLSDGWCLNFAVGCSHACPFCYVDEIHKRFGRRRYGDAVLQEWGDYLLIPENLDDAIRRTAWSRWAGKEAMMSSTHDPYLPKLASSARKILEHALPAGVHVCLQTRSFLVTKDFALLAKYPDQVRLQVSIATMDRDFARLIEPRVPPPEARLEVLRRARDAGVPTGVILAPIFPPTTVRPDVIADLQTMAQVLEDIEPEHIYGESLHVRGQNLRLLEGALSERVRVTSGFDRGVARIFHQELRKSGLKGTWWYES
jgi:DNA repair photolyase